MTRGMPWRHAERLAVVDSGNRVALLDLDRLDQPPMLLTDTAASIWRAIDGERVVPEITTEVAAAYGVEPSAIRAEVETFIAQLAEARLIVVAG